MKALIVLAVLASSAAPSLGHDAPSGWSYPSSCCSDVDCREVPTSYVQETWAGYHLIKSHEIVPYGDKRVKDSPDGLFHWFTRGGTDKGDTLCLFVPPRGY